MAELPTPDTALDAFARTQGLPEPSHMVYRAPDGSLGGGVDWDTVRRDVRAISAPVVAAVLREMASNEFAGPSGAHARQALHARADQYDSQGW